VAVTRKGAILEKVDVTQFASADHRRFVAAKKLRLKVFDVFL